MEGEGYVRILRSCLGDQTVKKASEVGERLEILINKGLIIAKSSVSFREAIKDKKGLCEGRQRGITLNL